MPDEYIAKIDGVAKIDSKNYLKDINATGLKVLDFGCGTGEYGLRLARQAREVHFYDIPNRATEFLKWRIADRKLENCKIVSEMDNDYDIIINVDVLEHVYKPVELLKELTVKVRS